MAYDILLVDDDIELCELLKQYLTQEGINVSVIHNGAEAISHLEKTENSYAAIILDFMLPGMQGLEVLQKLRRFNNTPVLMLTARGEDIDRIIGLEAGADDYLPKPCNPRELVARLRAILRRSDNLPPSTSNTLEAHGIKIDPGKRSIVCNQQTLDLTTAEFNTLEALVKNIGNVVSKEDLTELALNRKFTRYDRSIDVHISSIRKKLTAILGEKELIKTVRGTGYILVNESDV